MSNVKQSEEWLACKAMLRIQGYTQHKNHWVMFQSKDSPSNIVYSPGKKRWIAAYKDRHLKDTLTEIMNGKE